LLFLRADCEGESEEQREHERESFLHGQRG
jgi:hypothetical protein